VVMNDLPPVLGERKMDCSRLVKYIVETDEVDCSRWVK
jgi:hypothetical protein